MRVVKENKSFVSVNNDISGLIFDDSNNSMHPVRYYNLINSSGNNINVNCSYYGYVYQGKMFLKLDDREITLQEKMYFSLSGDFEYILTGKAILVEVIHNKGIYNSFKAMNQFGLIEETGRLKYIDGCTDSILIHPIKKGFPCLNSLHFPKNIRQTFHTHSSHRIGMVLRGQGECQTPFGNLPLKQGDIFVIKSWDGTQYSEGIDGEKYPNGLHCFYTFDKEMDVIAFHPDSDFGALDEDHPMINKTLVNGLSAKYISEIRTK